MEQFPLYSLRPQKFNRRSECANCAGFVRVLERTKKRGRRNRPRLCLKFRGTQRMATTFSPDAFRYSSVFLRACPQIVFDNDVVATKHRIRLVARNLHRYLCGDSSLHHVADNRTPRIVKSAVFNSRTSKGRAPRFSEFVQGSALAMENEFGELYRALRLDLPGGLAALDQFSQLAFERNNPTLAVFAVLGGEPERIAFEVLPRERRDFALAHSGQIDNRT
jgi:hypothetical protein